MRKVDTGCNGIPNLTQMDVLLHKFKIKLFIYKPKLGSLLHTICIDLSVICAFSELNWQLRQIWIETYDKSDTT